MSLELYRAWENSPDRRVVHIMQIERGDGSAANRLTLTDVPYVDKGVSGVRYHDTYPAPQQCIESDIITTERFDSVSFDDIVILNGTGNFDSLITDNNIVGQSFVMLKGDQSWSLMETDLPYRFEQIFKGQIAAVVREHGRIRLKIVPVIYDLNIKVGYEGFPKGYGYVLNAELQLIDSVTNEYKFTSFNLRDYEANMEVRDNGAVLVHPDSGADYSIVYVSSIFYGNIQAAVAPSGKLTADFNIDYAGQLIRNAQWVIHVEGLANAYHSLLNQTLDASAVGDVFCMVEGEAAFYVLDSYGTGLGAGLLRKYTLGTPGDLSTQAVSGASKDIYAVTGATFLWGIWVDADQELMYAVGGDGIADQAYLMEFGTPGDQSTLTLQDSYDLTGLASLDPAEIRANPAGDRVWIMFYDGVIHQFDMTAGDIATLSPDGATLDCRIFDRRAGAFTFANAGANLYVTGDAYCCTWQLELPTAYDLTEVVWTRKHYLHAEAVGYVDPFKIHVSAASIFCMDLGEFIDQIDLIGADYDLPPAVLTSSIYNTDQESQVGVHYSTLTPIGQVLTDICSSIGAAYCIDRHGQFRLGKTEAPEDAASYYPRITVYWHHFIGEFGKHIESQGTDLPARSVSMTYRKLQTVQSEGELAGSLTQDEKFSYSRPYSIYTVTNTLDAWQESEDLLIDGHIAVSSTFSNNMVQRWADLKSQVRYYYSLTISLMATPLHSIWGLGDIIVVGDDWMHPDIAAADKLQVLGRVINWTKQQQTLEVMK